MVSIQCPPRREAHLISLTLREDRCSASPNDSILVAVQVGREPQGLQDATTVLSLRHAIDGEVQGDVPLNP